MDGGETTGNKRSFSRISEDGTSEEPEDHIEVETAAEVERERVATITSMEIPDIDEITLDTAWWLKFTGPGRSEAMNPVVRTCGGGTSISQNAYDLLLEWYGESKYVLLSYIIVGGGPSSSALVDPKSKLIEALDLANAPKGRLWRSHVYGNVVNPGDLSRMTLKSVDPTTIIQNLCLAEVDMVIIEPPDLFPAGRMGLNNLGNTCFMNSSLQCLLHIEELIVYFLSSKYKQDINKDNPIGCGGDVAESFASLIKKVYSERSSSISPTAFRLTIGRFNRAFASYMQQDSQEFTVFLLDSLHEDLNKVKTKPPTSKPELPDGVPATDKEAVAKLAHECWETHVKRNDSEIQNLFTGLYKSTVVCPVCSYISVTFDPFFDLTLPLPSKTGKWVHRVLFMPLHGLPQTFEVALEPHASVENLKLQVKNLTGSLSDLVLVDLFGSRFYRYLADGELVAVKVATDDVLVAYEMTDNAIPVYLRVNERTFFGLPFYIEDSKDVSELKDRVSRRFAELHEGTLDESPNIRLSVFDGPPDSFGRLSGRDCRSLEIESPENKEIFDTQETLVRQDSSSSISSLSGPVSSPGATFDKTTPTSPSIQEPCESSKSELADENGESIGSNVEPEFLVGHATLVVDFDLQESLEVTPAQPLENPIAVEARKEASTMHTATLDQCLDRFAQPEVLGEQDEWYCTKCKEFRRASKQMELWSVPDIFMIHIKRFSDFQSVRDKITDLVDFPVENWNVSKHVSGPAAQSQEIVYDLVAVDNHYGSLGGGHYTAYAHNSVGDGKWYYYDDSRVTERDPKDAVSSAAYLLFYRKRQESNKATTLRAKASINELRESLMDNNLSKPIVAPAPPAPPAPPRSEEKTTYWGTGHRLGGDTMAPAAALPWASPASPASLASTAFKAEKDSSEDKTPGGSDVEGMTDLQLEPLV